MKIRLPQALIRSLTAVAVFVTPLATTVATGSFFASTASAAIEVVREGGDFVLERTSNGEGGYTFVSTTDQYTDLWAVNESDNIYFPIKEGSDSNALLDALNKNQGFSVGLSVPSPDVSVDEVTIISFGDGKPNFSLEVDVTTKKGKPVITRTLYANANDENESNFEDLQFNSDAPTLNVSWAGSKLTGTLDGDSVSWSPADLGSVQSVTLNANYVTSFTISIAASSTVKYGDGLSKYYGTGTVLENKFGSAVAIVLSDSGVHSVTNNTNLGAVQGADVYIGGAAQLKVSATTLSQDLSGGNKTIFIDGGNSDAALVLSAADDDSRARVYLGKVELVSDATIDVAEGTNEKVTLLDAMKSEGKNLTIKSSGDSDANGLSLGRSGSKSGTISVASLTLDDASLYLNGGTATAGSVKVERNGTNSGSLTNVTMDDSGLKKESGASDGAVSNAAVTVSGDNKVVTDVEVKGSTITFSGAGAFVNLVEMANGSKVELKDGSVTGSSVKGSTVTAQDKVTVSDTNVTDGSVITLGGADSSISDGTITGSTVTLSGNNGTVSGGTVTGSAITLSGENAGISGATITDGSTVTLSGSNGTVSGGSITGSTVALSGTGSKLGYTAPVVILSESEVAGSSPVTTVENSTINLSDGTSIDRNVKVSNSTINVLENATATIGGDLQSDVIALQNACSLKVKDAVLSGSTHFETAEGATATSLRVESSQIWLTSTNIGDITQVTRDGKSGLQFSANLFADLSASSIELSDIPLCFTRDLIDALERQHEDRFGYKGLHYLEVNFANGESATVTLSNVEGWHVGGELPSDGQMTWGAVNDGGMISGVVFLDSPVSNIPEPTTATLSALALAALAARRRRKR